MPSTAHHGSGRPGPQSLLVAWALCGRRVLVVGGGHVAAGKIESLQRTGAKLTVVAPTLTEDLVAAVRSGAFTWHARRFRAYDVYRCALVVAATDDEAVNLRVARWAKRAGALVNVVDTPAACDLTMPAVVQRGPVRLAISTDGATPAGARFLREELDRDLPEGLGTLFEHAASARALLRDCGRYRYDYLAWRQDFFEPGWRAVQAGRTGELAQLRARFLDSFDATGTPGPSARTAVPPLRTRKERPGRVVETLGRAVWGAEGARPAGWPDRSAG